MKSYTDIEQSKRLEEILPIESADMYYPNRIDIKYQGALPIEFKRGNPLLSQEIAAWSLAALLDVLPDIDNYYLVLDKEDKEYCCCYEDYNGESFRHCFYDNPVDACYEVIIKLHELKML